MSMTDPHGVIPPWELPHRLVRAREWAGMTQSDLATALDIGVRTVKRYESGESTKRGIILGWALACGVDPGWLEHGFAPNGGPTHTAPDTGRYAPTWLLPAAA